MAVFRAGVSFLTLTGHVVAAQGLKPPKGGEAGVGAGEPSCGTSGSSKGWD